MNSIVVPSFHSASSPRPPQSEATTRSRSQTLRTTETHRKHQGGGRLLTLLTLAAALSSVACFETPVPPQTVALSSWELETGHTGFTSDLYPSGGLEGAACFTVVSPCSDPLQRHLDAVEISGDLPNPGKVELSIEPHLAPRARNAGTRSGRWFADNFLSTTERGLNDWCTGTWKVSLPFPLSNGPEDESEGDTACGNAFNGANITMVIDWDASQKTGSGALKATHGTTERVFACESGEAIARLQPYGPESNTSPDDDARAYPLVLEGGQDTVGAELSRVRLLEAAHHEVVLAAGGERLTLQPGQWTDVPQGFSANTAWRLHGDSPESGRGLPRVAMEWQCREPRLDPLPQGYRFELPGMAQEILVRQGTNLADRPVVTFEPRGKPELLTGLVATPDGHGGYRVRGGISGVSLDASLRIEDDQMRLTGELELAGDTYPVEAVGGSF